MTWLSSATTPDDVRAAVTVTASVVAVSTTVPLTVSAAVPDRETMAVSTTVPLTVKDAVAVVVEVALSST